MEQKMPQQAAQKKNRKGFASEISASWKRSWKGLTRIQKVITILLALVVLFVFYVVLDANKYPALVRVIEGRESVGVNPTDRALDFGDLARGTSLIRRVNLQNGTFMPMYVFMVKTGSIAGLMEINKNNFKLMPRTAQKIEFSTYIPASATVGQTYKGRVYLFKIPTFGL